MSKETQVVSQQNENSSVEVVYVVTRYGQIYGVYRNLDDAIQVVRFMIAKGQLADIQTQSIK